MTFQETISNTIDQYGEAVTVTPQSTTDYDEDISWTKTGGTPFVTNVVPYDSFFSKIQFQDYGNMSLADIKLIGKGDITFERGDTFVYSTKTYNITRVNPLPLQGEILAVVIDGNEVL